MMHPDCNTVGKERVRWRRCYMASLRLVKLEDGVIPIRVPDLSEHIVGAFTN
jgi:hypothetical protein